MRKHILYKLVIAAVLIFFVMSSLSPAQMTFEQNKAAVSENDFEIKFTIMFSENDLQFDKLLGYDVVKLNEGTFINEIGKPMLPAKEIKVALPAGMEVTQVKVTDTSSVDIKGKYTIFPAQPPRRTNGLDEDVPFVQPDVEIYNSINPYPSKLVEFVHQTDLAGQGIAIIQLYPVQYTPGEKKLTLYTTISFVIEGVDGYICGDYLPKVISESSRNMYEQMIQDMVINPEDVEIRYLDGDGGPQKMGVDPGDYDYVIITQSSWIDDFQPLIEWKTKKGVPATVVDTSWIYSEYSGTNDEDKIQAFVQDAHSTWGATFFLLGGDIAYVPTRTEYYHLYLSGSWEDIYAPADTYYADYDNDFLCEVNVGRASVTGDSAISTFINKILTYEQSPPTGDDYPMKASLLGFDLDGSTDGEDLKIYIDNNYLDASWTMDNVYDSHSGNHETNAKAAINSGQNLINHIDHGTWNYMGVGSQHGYYLSLSEVSAFYNGDRQSILYSIACDVNAFDHSSCISECFVRDTNGGCIAFVGNTRYGVYYQGDVYSLSFRQDREFFEAIFEEGHHILGEAFSDAKNEAPSSSSTLRFLFDELNLLGDPQLPIWTADPKDFDVTYDTFIDQGPSSFLVHVEEVGGGNVDQAYVCVWKDSDDEVYETGYTNVNGDVSLSISPTSGGTMYVTVTKDNFIPHMGEAEVDAHGSPFEPSNPSPVNYEIDVLLDAILSWTGGDPAGDPCTYDVYFEADDSTPDVLVSAGQSAESYDPPGDMDVMTTYYWQIIADDDDPVSDPTEGPIWQFTTEDNVLPEWRNQGQNKTIIQPGESISLYAQGKDNIGLDYAYLAINETGEWVPFAGGNWWDINWDYHKKIVINHSLVEADLQNFPVLITHTSSDFINHAQTDGDDFAFVDADNITQYKHEIEYYDSGTGELVAWVNIPVLGSTEDTVLYLYYGNLDCSNQENVEGTWNADFLMVHHMDGSDYTELDDSTSNHWNVTSAGGDPSYNQDGKIGRCVDFDGDFDYLKTGDFGLPEDSSYTGCAWVYVDGNAGLVREVFEGDSDFGISLMVWSDERFRNHAHTSEGTAYCYSTTTVNTGSPEWFYICTRADAENDQLDIFVNGVSEDNSTISGTINPETEGLNIGTSKDNNNYWMNGKIDEIHISDMVRSDDWIKTEYNNMASPSTFAIVGYEVARSGGEKYGSPMDLDSGADEWVWSNFTWQNPDITEGTTISWRIYYVDSSRNEIATDIMSFDVGVPTIPGDLNHDGCVDLSDLAQLLAHYGTSSGATYEDGDLDGDGDVDLSDLAELLAHYGECQ